MKLTSIAFRSASECTLILGLFALISSCASSEGAAAQKFNPTGFSLVYLLAGDNQGASSEELSQEHFAFMKGLAADGKLLLAGPFGPDKHHEDLSGIFLIDEADPEKARELAGEDPPTKLGVFRQEVVPLTTLDVIRYLPAVEKLRVERRLAAGESTDQPDVRAYTILTAPDGPRAAEEVFSNPAIGDVVVLMARMGSPREDELFAILDVPSAEEARARLRVANPDGLEIHVSDWYSSPALAELVQGGGPPEELLNGAGR